MKNVGKVDLKKVQDVDTAFKPQVKTAALKRRNTLLRNKAKYIEENGNIQLPPENLYEMIRKRLQEKLDYT